MTRDSNGWWWIMGGAILTALASDSAMLNDMTPDDYEKTVHAWIKFLSIIVVAVSGVARMSPLPISPEGRVEQIQKNADHADRATWAASKAATASSVAAKASSVAVESAQVAAESAQVAVTESEKASGIQDQ